MPYSVVDTVFGGPNGPAGLIATQAAEGMGARRFWKLRVPDGEAPDDGFLTLKIYPGQPGNGVALPPGRYKLTNEFAKFLALSDASINSLGIKTEGTDVYATLVPATVCKAEKAVVSKPNGEIVYN